MEDLEPFEMLRGRRHAAVIGPAADGGYYLIGLHTLSPDLFEHVPWSTPEVLTETLTAAKKLGVSVSLLPTWYDVDGVDDLRRVMREQSAGKGRAPGSPHARTSIG